MMDVKRVSLYTLDYDSTGRREEVAYQYTGDNKGWQDPYGGEFDACEERQFDAVLAGERTHVILAVGTKFEKRIDLRVAVK